MRKGETWEEAGTGWGRALTPARKAVCCPATRVSRESDWVIFWFLKLALLQCAG